MDTTYNEGITGPTGSRFGTTDPGQPARRVIATPFIGTRSRKGNTERGIGVELSHFHGKGYIFHSTESKNPKEYIRAFEILMHMERIDPDILLSCLYAGKKQAHHNDNQFHWLRKYQPVQLQKIFEKRALVFEKPCDETVLRTIISHFHSQGVSIDDPFAKAPEKESRASTGNIPHRRGAGIRAESLSFA